MSRLNVLASGLWQWLVLRAPLLATVVLVAVGGVVVSFIARRVVRYLIRRTGIEALLERVGVANLLYAIGLRQGVAHLGGQLSLAGGLLLTVALVADLLELSALSAAIAIAAAYLPRLLSASAVLLAGVAAATVVRKLVRRMAAERSDLENKGFVSEASYYVIVIVSVAWAAEQAGFETDIVTSLIKILLGVLIAGLALSVALGFRAIFHNIAVRHYYERLLQPGDLVRIGDIDGIVVQFTPVALILRSERGEHVIPCKLLLEGPFRVERALPAEPHDENEDPVESRSE